LGLGEDGVAIDAIAKSDDAIGESFKQLYFLHTAHTTCLFDGWELDGDIVIILIDL
jgi:hypothetical protein